MESVRFYEEIIPEPDYMYFNTYNKDAELITPSKVATTIVFYNEEGYKMQQTMASLGAQEKISEEGQDLLLVGDGLAQMHPSMSKFLESMFDYVPLTIDQWPEWGNTCVINNGSYCHWKQGRLCLVLKKNNLRKWNSHEWPLRSFAKTSKYCFLTDVGAQYYTTVIHSFIRYLKGHPKCVAVTGRKMAQTNPQQTNYTSGPLEDNFNEKILRLIQTVKYEHENNTSLIIGSIIGAMRVLHGPCTFIDYNSISDNEYIDMYFQLAYKTPRDVGVLMSQIRLAEDGLQAIYAITHLDQHETETALVEKAEFYFDVELTWEKFAKQQRRWENANFATAIYFIFGAKGQPHTIWGSKQPFWKKLCSSIVSLLWIIVLVLFKFNIALYAATFYYCHLVLWSTLFGPSDEVYIACRAVLFIYMALYIVFVLRHIKRIGSSDCSFSNSLWFTVYMVNAMNMAILITVLLLAYSDGIPNTIEDEINVFNQLGVWVVIGQFLPLLRTIYTKPRFFVGILCDPYTIIAWTISLPTVIAFFRAYHLARAMDFSWGTRPGGDILSPLSPKSNDAKTCSITECTLPVHNSDSLVCADHAWMKKHIRNWNMANLMIVLANVMLTVIMVYMPWGLSFLRTYSFALLSPLLFVVFWVVIADLFRSGRTLVNAAVSTKHIC